MSFNYEAFFADNFQIIDKKTKRVPLILNVVQKRYLSERHNKNVILKARQQGFSTVIDACIAAKFLLQPNFRAVIVADRKENAEGLLARFKLFIESWEEKNGVKIPRPRDSIGTIINGANGASVLVGTAQNYDVGRSRTYDEAHLSEFAFYPKGERILTSVAQAVPESGTLNIETTANGFNFFKTLWDNSVLQINPYQPMFFAASEFYSTQFLDEKKRELGRYFVQEYPETPEEAFLTSGETYFDKEALAHYLAHAKQPEGDYDN